MQTASMRMLTYSESDKSKTEGQRRSAHGTVEILIYQNPVSTWPKKYSAYVLIAG